jgi:hypothetical protein
MAGRGLQRASGGRVTQTLFVNKPDGHRRQSVDVDSSNIPAIEQRAGNRLDEARLQHERLGWSLVRLVMGTIVVSENGEKNSERRGQDNQSYRASHDCTSNEISFLSGLPGVKGVA